MTDKVIMESASPFLYLLELLRGQPKPERKGTIFFPYHSTHHITVEMDFETLAEELTHLHDEYQPVTVCIYWRDYNLGHHLSFQKRGLHIVSAGHIYDPLFLFRYHHLCSMHRYAASNGLGSQLFYSVKSGCSYFHLDTIKYSRAADSTVPKCAVAGHPPAIESAFRSLFSIPRPSTAAEQMEMVDYCLGADYFRSPRELRQQLVYAELLDKAGFVTRGRGEVANLAIPTYYRRLSRSLRSKLPAPVKQRLKQGNA